MLLDDITVVQIGAYLSILLTGGIVLFRTLLHMMTWVKVNCHVYVIKVTSSPGKPMHLSGYKELHVRVSGSDHYLSWTTYERKT